MLPEPDRPARAPSSRPGPRAKAGRQPLPMDFQVRFWLAVLLLSAVAAHAKPMPAPSLEEAQRSSRAVVAEYVDYTADGNIGYFSGPVARYRIVRGNYTTPGQIVRIRYQFQDGSACLEPQGWVFSESMMPKKGSLWTLYLQGEGPILDTYRGSFGRQPLTR